MALTRKMKWRRLMRRIFGPPHPYIGDLKLIKLKYRPMYELKFRGGAGDALNGLWLAYHAGHLAGRE